jgi:ABC-type lipoprotein export system ATPase subunit
MIEVRNVSKRYLDGDNEVVAVNRAEFALEAGDFILIIGRSGSGKSTLLSMLGGLARPDDGSVILDGDDIWTIPDSRLSRIRAEKIGFIFQFSGLLPTLTAIDNVMVPSLFCTDDGTCRKRATDLLASFGLSAKTGSYPSQLSGGELKRVAIARALINDPSLILADEPTGDLDAATEKTIMEYIRDINRRGKTVVMVTHCPELSVYANKVFMMENGIIEEVTSEYITS